MHYGKTHETELYNKMLWNKTRDSLRAGLPLLGTPPLPADLAQGEDLQKNMKAFAAHGLRLDRYEWER